MFKRLACVAMALLLFGSFGCGDDPARPPRPTPPPPLGLQVYNETTPNAALRLPSNEVFDVFVDSQNRIWFSTEAGVAMSDGAQPIVVFDQFAGVPNRQTRVIKELNGRIWVGTWGGGVAYYDGTLPWVPLIVNRLASSRVFDIAVDDSSLWIATVNGLSQYVDDQTLPLSRQYINHTNKLGSITLIPSTIVHNDPARGPEIWLGTQANGLAIMRLPQIHGVYGFAGDAVFAVGDGGSVFRYDGTTWRSLAGTRTTARFRAVWGFDRNAVHAVGDGGVARLRSGTRWFIKTTGTGARLNALWGTARNNIYTVGNNGTVLRYNGVNWVPRDPGTSVDLNGIHGFSAGDIYAVGEGGTIIHFDGASWLPDVSPTTQTLRSVWTATNAVFAVGDNGTILHKPDSTWTVMVSGTNEHLRKVFGSSESDVYAVGDNGTALRYDGINWTPVSGASPTMDLQDVWAAPADTAFAVGELADFFGGSDRFFRFNGASWGPMRNGTDQFFMSTQAVPSNSGIPGSDVSQVAYDVVSGLFWLAFPDVGLASIDVNNSVWTRFTTLDGLVSDLASSVAPRMNGNIWLGSQSGVTRLSVTRQVTNFTRGSGLPDERIRKVYIDSQDRVWLAFVGAGAGRVR